MSNSIGSSDEPQVETVLQPYDLHVLICTNTRPAGAKSSCGPHGAEGFRALLKDWLKTEVSARPALAGKIKARVNGSGCLDFCTKGLAMAIYPDGEFLLNLRPETRPGDVEQVKQRLRTKLDELEQALSNAR